MSLDLVIRGGLVADGTGAPLRRQDVGVRDGSVAAVGELDDSASQVIDAEGLIVAPGFVDVHTHYDAQLLWDPTASPSPLHGVTTVIGGNCGFSIAPSGPEHAGYLAEMMARVEGMPLAALQQGLDWRWTGFGEWLDRLEGRIAVNAGFLVGHSTLRRAVMGDDAVGGEPSDADLKEMELSLHRALEEGALGFSTSQAHTHHDGHGDPVPSRWASRSELELLAWAVRAHPGTTVEMIVPGCINGFTPEEVDLLAAMSLLANRPVNWNVLGVSSANPQRVEDQLEASTAAAKRGASVLALALPHSMRVRLCFAGGAILDGLPGWREVMALPIPDRIVALSDPETRRRLDAGAQSEEAGVLGALATWKRLVIDETFHPDNARYQGRTVGDVARDLGADPFDVLLDIVVRDELRTGLRPPFPESEADWQLRAKVWRDPRVVVGGSDAGAHLDTMCGAVYATSLLGEGIRQRGLLSWEEGIRLLTDVPARLYGLRDRGRLQVGSRADVVMFDPESVGHGPERTRDDLPGGASRLYAEGVGVEHVLVNGVELVHHGVFTDATSGSVLRSGRDTDTVTVPGGATYAPPGAS